jgi:ethanolamine utilization protein EutQ
MRFVILPLLVVTALPATAGESIQPVLLRGATVQGEVFSDPRATSLTEESEAGRTAARDLVVHEGSDNCLQTGVYETAGPNRYTSSAAQPYPHDEFMHFLSGGVTLRSSDGTTTEVKAGDSVLLPKGWTGVWDSAGYRKIYVIHDCNKE